MSKMQEGADVGALEVTGTREDMGRKLARILERAGESRVIAVELLGMLYGESVPSQSQGGDPADEQPGFFPDAFAVTEKVLAVQEETLSLLVSIRDRL